MPRLAAVLPAILALIACNPRAERQSDPRPLATTEKQPSRHTVTKKPPFRAVTFNAGLAVGVLRHASQRAPRVIEALRELPVELLCVQEVWHEQHWQRLRRATAERWPTTLRPGVPRAQGPSCSRDEVAPVRACVLRHCSDEAQASLAGCVGMRCGHLALTLTEGCAGCLTRDPLRSVRETLAECVSEDHRTQTARGETAHAFGGSTGLALLTNQKVVDRGLLRLTSRQVSRSVIYALVDSESIGQLHVFCTHLTPVLRGVPYPGTGSWQAEQDRQVSELLDFVAKQAKDEPTLLLGDLNTGPGIGARLHPRQPDNYRQIVASGFVEPYLAKDEPLCTFCYDNPVTRSRTPGGLLIDHVLVRKLPGRARAERILDQPVTLDVEGRAVRTRLSDHYGVKLTIQP